ncbi:hypothetical protein Leryth_023846 [Lithospermum erythrorhizon]|nr:hypothetical protein Leryth_023846 [Lithospermum erythrorhizon]
MFKFKDLVLVNIFNAQLIFILSDHRTTRFLTSALILSSQLAFTASFAFFLVKQKFTPYSVNTVFLLTLGAVLLGFCSNGDRPEGEAKEEYVLGFVMMILNACIYGFLMPLIEMCYRKRKQEVCYSLAMEFNMVMCFSATVFCSVGTSTKIFRPLQGRQENSI